MIARSLLAATLLGLSLGQAHALVVDPEGPTITDPAATTFIFADALTATSTGGVATVTPPYAAFDLEFVQLSTALGAELRMLDPADTQVMRAVAADLEFDGGSLFSATMQVVSDLVGIFGPAVRVTLELNQPFVPGTLYQGTGSLTVQDLVPEETPVIPLPAGLPLLLTGVAGLGALRRSRG